MFDRSKPNIILLSDYTDVIYMNKTLGVHKIACELRRAGFEVLVINHLHVFTFDELTHVIQNSVNENTLYVGVSSFFYLTSDSPSQLIDKEHEAGGISYQPKELGAFLPHGLKYNQPLKDLITSINPKCKLVLGGHDAKDAGYIKDYDYVVFGYADISAVNLAKHLAYGEELKHSRRSLFGATIIDDATAEGYEFISTPMQYTDNDVIMPGETLGIEISRGCVFKCAYCTYPLNGKKKNDYIKLEEILTQEFVENYEKFGVTRYTFSDDTFNDSRDKIEMVHRISKSLPFKLEFWAYVRADLLAAHPDTIDLLFDSGLRAGFMGIETMHPTAGSIIGKGGGRQKIIEVIDYIKTKYSNSVALTGSFIFGLPSEPLDSIKETAQMLLDKKIKLDAWQINPLRINPNHTFKSEFDLNYEKYGYRVIGQNSEGLTWENEYTNYHECAELAKSTMIAGDLNGNRRINGRSSFCIASLGFDLDYSMNKKVTEFDWHRTDLQKQKRAVQYKEQLFKVLGIV